jgi:ABC-type cobalamin/Fe3+-siderophores transport system ATPase subunit
MNRISLKADNVKVKRTGRVILDLNQLSVEEGEFVSVLGSNGAGKTTLLKLLCGLVKPNEGLAEFNGTNLSDVSEWGKTNLRKRIGYIPQQAEYNSELPFTLREIVSMGRTGARGLFGRESIQGGGLIDYWIERLGLADFSGQTFNTLSGGEQQKALLARAMVQQPDMLMLDEPCGNLDFHWKQQITDIISELHKETGITVVMVSHETELVPAGCRRVIIMNNGRIIADGGTEEVFNSGALEKAYGCKIKAVDIGGRKFAVTGLQKQGGR